MDISKFWKEVTRSFQLCTWKCYQLIWLWCQLCGWQIFTPWHGRFFKKDFTVILGIGKKFEKFFGINVFSWIKENSWWRWNGQCDIILFCCVYAPKSLESSTNTDCSMFEAKQIQTVLYNFWAISFLLLKKCQKL